MSNTIAAPAYVYELQEPIRQPTPSKPMNPCPSLHNGNEYPRISGWPILRYRAGLVEYFRG